MLSLDWNILWTCINLVIFYILMKKFVWNKVLGAMEKRKTMINNQIKDANDQRREADKLKTQYEERLATAGEESQRLIADATLSAKAKADKIVVSAQKSSDKILKDARQTIEIERQDALSSVKHDIASLALDAAAKVVGKEAKDVDNSAIFDEFINDNGGEE